jgi:phenylpropionate dioxygenase-like ring-hydroxylating dioxygenase large terminal subunit
MSRSYPPSPYPNGWYAVTSIAELQKKKVVPIRALGRDMVAFQTESGAFSVLDAHCPHQGAHLGYGGTIKGENIECPFHKWCFDTDGKCENVPYSNTTPRGKKAELHKYPVAERLGMILVYYSSDYSEPTWEVARFDDELQGNWSKPSYSEMFIRTHIQEFAENAMDVPHFQPVHGSEENSVDLDKQQPFGAHLQFMLNLVYPGSGMGQFGKRVGVRVRWRLNGLGMFDNFVTMREYPMEIQQCFFFTPLDDGMIRLQFLLRVNKDKIKLINPFRYLVVKLIETQNRKILLRNFEEDRDIWENKKFREHPLLCQGDGPIPHLRTWMKQFYTLDKEGVLQTLQSPSCSAGTPS